MLNKIFYKFHLVYHNVFKNRNNSNSLLWNNTCFTKQTHSLYKCNFSNEVELALNKQIESEKLAAAAYLEIAVKFLHPSVAYMGAGGFFMKMYEEELGHMKQFINYQLTRGGIPIVGCKSNMDNVNLVDAFKKSLDMEKKITEQLHDLVSIAESNRDYQCADFVCSKFLAEQMTAINELSQQLTNLKNFANSKHAMYHFDLQLAKMHPYSLK